jgi:hypothetical protein
MIRHPFKRLFLVPFAWICALVPTAASAQFTTRVKEGLKAAGDPAGLSGGPGLEAMIGSIINIVLGTVGVILLGLMIYAGFLWMTAGGDKEKVTKARGMIFNAFMGLIIVVLAYAIAEFVIDRVIEIQSGVSVSGTDVSP